MTHVACTCGQTHPKGQRCPHYQPPSGRPGSTRAWRRLRQRILTRDHHHCTICGSTERLEVDHIDGDWRNDHPDNLRTVCFNHNPRGGGRGAGSPRTQPVRTLPATSSRNKLAGSDSGEVLVA